MPCRFSTNFHELPRCENPGVIQEGVLVRNSDATVASSQLIWQTKAVEKCICWDALRIFHFYLTLKADNCFSLWYWRNADIAIIVLWISLSIILSGSKDLYSIMAKQGHCLSSFISLKKSPRLRKFWNVYHKKWVCPDWKKLGSLQRTRLRSFISHGKRWQMTTPPYESLVTVFQRCS